MTRKGEGKSEYYQYQEAYGGLVSRVSSYAREKMFASFMQRACPTASMRVLDVGVTSDERADSNFFESYYPYPENLTAVGLEDGTFLERKFPGLTYVKADALDLPFADASFDLAVSWAVIEHVGSRQRQRKFVSEIARVSRSFFLTTPNRWYPVEFHTVTPFLHWLPAANFQAALRLLGRDFYASEETLNLLSEKDLLSLLPQNARVEKMHFRLFGPVSNLVIYVDQGLS